MLLPLAIIWRKYSGWVNGRWMKTICGKAVDVTRQIMANNYFENNIKQHFIIIYTLIYT